MSFGKSRYDKDGWEIIRFANLSGITVVGGFSKLLKYGLNENKIITNAQLAKVQKGKLGIKVLGNGELSKKLTVKATKFTASAVEKINAIGGNVEVI